MDRGTDYAWRATPTRVAALTLLLAGLCAGLGFAAATLVASAYTAHATVLVMPLEGNPFNPTGNGDDLNNLQSEAELAQSDAVAKLVAESGLDTGPRPTVTVPPNTQLLDFSFEARSPDAARAGAQSFASAYLAFRSSRNDQAVVTQSRAIQDEIVAQSDRIDELARQKQGVRSAEQRAAIQQQMNGIASQVVQLSTTLSAVTTVERDPGQVVTDGHIVGPSPTASRVRFSVAGAILGLVIGGALMVLTLRRTRDVLAAEDGPLPTVPSSATDGAQRAVRSPGRAVAQQP